MSECHPSSLALWAKLGDETWPERYHPVLCHLIDVAAVTMRLWDNMRPHLRHWVASRLDLDEASCGRWLAFWCGAHDIGKVDPYFQFQGKTDKLKSVLVGWPPTIWKEHHGKVSTAILADLLENPNGWPAITHHLALKVAVAVGGHHGLFPSSWIDLHDSLKTDTLCPWQAARRDIMRQLAQLLQVGPEVPRWVDPGDQSVFMVLAGLTSVADWIGSNVQFFDAAGTPEVAKHGLDVDAYLRHAMRQAGIALKALGWQQRQLSAEARTFRQLFANMEPRPLQEAVEAIVADLTEPTLIVVEAPMGEGKTEAAWYAADAWERHGSPGTYVALPTMATSDQMYDRVKALLTQQPNTGHLMLLHGKASLNDHFDDRFQLADIYDEDDSKRNHSPKAAAESWFAANKKHGLLAPYGVGTIDQVLLAVLQTKHVFVRLFGLAGKCVILDEVHAYDAYMTTLMERLLRWLAALGCPVVLLSATLPREKRWALIEAYAGQDVAEPNPEPYPRVTTMTLGGQARVHAIGASNRTQTIHLGWLDEEKLADTLRQALANGGCAAVIRNTVGLAQETFVKLRDALKNDGIEVELFHARFPFGRRKAIQDAVLERFGKDGGATERNRRVLVATQVVEQSLDLDFDVMFSDVAPVDLVLQRAGREHRHERGQRPSGVREARLWLIEPKPGKEGLPDFGDSEYVYARFVLLQSHIALKALEVVQLPMDLERLVEQVYGKEQLAMPPSWQPALDEARRELLEEKRIQRRKAKSILVYRPDDEDLLRQQNAQLDEDNPEAAETIRAATRDTEPTVLLIIIFHIDGADYLDPECQLPFKESKKPDIERIRRLLDNEVSIGHRGCVAFHAARLVPTGWQKCGMLRQHRVIRIDASGISLPTEFPMRFDEYVGVRLTREPLDKETP